jgi:hypothetical protein
VNPAWLDVDPWKPVVAPLQGDARSRSAQSLESIAAQFDVVHTARYQPSADGRTWCKTFLWDVLTALGCGEVAAHWVDPLTGQPCETGHGVETRANDVVMRLGRGMFGWRNSIELAAYARAELGYPTVVVWFNRAGPGHVALVLPGKVIAQAGGHNLWRKPVTAGFGDRAVSYFTHD